MNVHPSRLIAQCPMCQASYDDTAIKLVGERGTSKLFHCCCGACGHAMLAVILESSGWVSSVGVVTDLQAQDAQRLQDAAAISADECVRLHLALEQNSGELYQQLAGRLVG